MSSEHLYSDMAFEIGSSDFDHGEIMSVTHFKTDDEHPDVVKGSTTATPLEAVPYKFHEGELLEEIKAYIDATYGQHYSQTKFQASEFIFDGGHGIGMNVGCIMKYAQRYGKKDGYNRKDIMKIIHYAILLLYVHDEYVVKPQLIAKESK